MRSLATILKQLFTTLFMMFLIALATGIFFLIGGDVYLKTMYSKSPVVRHFPYTSTKETDETAYFKQTFADRELRKGNLEQLLRQEHGFKCEEIASVPRCLYVARGALNCVRSISLELRFADDAALASVLARSYVGCDG